MLTESEKLWLHNRQAWRAIQRHGRRSEWYSCVYCDYSGNKELCGSSPCRLEFSVASLIDALEFSERVAAKLATAYADYVKNRICIDFDLGMRCPGFQTCAMKRPHPPCDFAVLKGVRLQVEEEMDNANK